MIRTAVIGFGLGGSAFHAPLVAAVPELELSAIVTSRAEAVRERYPQAQAVADAQAVLDDSRIDLVVVTTPNDTHFALAKAALQAGKHVVVDKPFANRVAEAEELVALAAERGMVLSVFHNRRWDSDFLTVKGLIEAGRLGEVKLYEAQWDRFRPGLRQSWHEDAGPGGGVLIDLGPHLIDQALALFGPPEAVTGDVVAQRNGSQVDDYFNVTLHYGNMRAVLSSSSIVAAARPRFAVHGTKASFVKQGLDPQEAHLRAGGGANDPDYGIEQPATYGILVDGEGALETIRSERGDYRRFYAGVARAIAEGETPPVQAADAVAGLRIIELARESAQRGCRLPY